MRLTFEAFVIINRIELRFLLHSLSNKFIIIMSLLHSPQRIRIENQHERRVDPASPTKNDVNFYIRKINRLQNDFNAIQDELGNARVRLRKAEDYEIKYDLVLKQNNNLLAENDRLAKEIQTLRIESEKSKLKSQDEFGKKQDFTKQRSQLRSQIENLKKKIAETQQKKFQTSIDDKNKVEYSNKRELQLFRKDIVQRQERYQFQIRQLKRLLAQKQTVENVVGMKVDRVRKEKDEEISRLNGIIQKLHKQHEEAIQTKNEQLLKLAEKSEKMLNYQIQNIKLNLFNQDEIFGLEVNGLREMIAIKNQEITKLLLALKKSTEDCEKTENQLKQEIKLLKQSCYKNERQNQIQIYNLKERLTKIHAMDIDNIDSKYKQMLEIAGKEKIQLQKLLKAKDEELQLELRERERIKNQWNTKVIDKEGKIKQLLEKLEDTGKINSNELKYLHEAFHKIQCEKQAMTREYQENIGFLDQQIKWLSSNLQLKNLEIRHVQDELVDSKKHALQVQKDLETKWKQERRQRDEERDRDRHEKQVFQEEYKTRQRDLRLREKNFQKQKEKDQREKSKLNFMIQQLSKDNTRLNNYIKQLDEALKKQLKKNQLSTLDSTAMRRQLMSELERQKNELQTIKRMEVDQITKKFQVETDRYVALNQKLQTDLTNKTLEAASAQKQLKRIEEQNKNIEKANREKLIEYQKKMATLNNEIDLTHNLYQAFVESESRTKKQG